MGLIHSITQGIPLSKDEEILQSIQESKDEEVGIPIPSLFNSLNQFIVPYKLREYLK